MQLHRHDEIEGLHAEQTFYTSPMVMFLLPTIFLLISLGVSWAILAGKLPGLMWCSVAVVAPFVPLIFWINFLPALRSTNWVLKTATNRVYIHLRNYRNPSSPDDGPTVVSLAQNEIVSIGKHMERFASITSKGRATYWTEYSLELRLREPASAEFVTALEAERRREAPKTGWMRIGLYAPLVSLDKDQRAIRILWYSRYDHITPRINKAIALLGRTFLTHDDVFVNNTDLEKLSDVQFDDVIVKLLEGNSKLDAIKLLVKRRGMSTTEANRFVDELLQKNR
jgi:hypothetical protein